MSPDDRHPVLQNLRRRAEDLLRKTRTELSRMSPGKLEALAHELQVHQVELEMQNEELRRAQTDLEEARDRARQLYDFAPAGLLTLDERRIVREASLTAAVQLGANRSDLIGASLSDFIVREDQDAFHLWRSRLVETQIKQSCEIRFRRPAGGFFWARLEGVPFSAGPGESQRIRVYLVDVTDSRRTEAGLKSAILQLRAVFDAARDPIVVTDPRSIIQQAGRSLERVFGWEAGEVIGRDVSMLIAEPDRPKHADFLSRYQHATSSVRREFEAVRKDGSVFPIELSITRLDVPGSEEPMYIEIVRDITVQRDLQDEIRRPIGLFQSLLDEGTEAVVFMSPGREILMWNLGAENLFGYMQEEVSGRDFREILAAADGSAKGGTAGPAVLEDLREGKVARIEGHALRKDGEKLPVSAVFSPFMRGEGELVAIVCVCRERPAR
ncbi:MAG: PAS domain S-box protein [Candidatus Tectomicrobia bacterium]|uniref:PAS domain S-box protein n=1 Tax=Tectimicrobiota bacterium TaxID=2528274 RepID=A0A932HZF0_UNCTE|nr:PAS domain S-box protein [Candidatus Tectomicrobia bacterium]